jgi:hypothetical protein
MKLEATGTPNEYLLTLKAGEPIEILLPDDWLGRTGPGELRARHQRRLTELHRRMYPRTPNNYQRQFASSKR